jgi:hypothetical protein
VTGRGAGGILATILLLAALTAAAAEVPLVDSLSGPAKEDYRSAVLLYEDGDFVGALVKFKSAHARSSEPRLLWNIAACEKNLRHYATVLDIVERYRRETAGRLSPERQREVEALIGAVRALVSVVHVKVDEPGASVLVDGQPAGTTPLDHPLLVDLGQRQVTVTKAGFKEHRITQDFAGGSETTLAITLQRAPVAGRLTVDTGEQNATITIDGRVVGERRWEGPLSNGPHQVRVSGLGLRTQTSEVRVSEGEARTLHLTLEPERQGRIPTLVWVGGGLLVAGGLGAGAYFLFRPGSAAGPTIGTLSPGTVQLPLNLH